MCRYQLDQLENIPDNCIVAGNPARVVKSM